MPLTLQQQLALARLGANVSGNTDMGSGLGAASTGLGAWRGFQSGTTAGDVGGTADVAKLATTNIPGTGGNLLTDMGLSKGTASGLNTGATGALDALAIYNGLKQGGVGGYGSAVGGALQGAGLLMNNPALTTAGGYVLAPLAVYNAVKNWQSGNTGSDALQGAEAGAAVGSVVPVIGTAIGALAGGALGALSSAFGGGEKDPETTNWDQYTKAVNSLPADQQATAAMGLTPAQAYQNLAGVMDAKNNTPGHSQPIEQVFGRMGEQNLMDQLTGEVNSAYKSGQITPGESIQDQWSKVINPWLTSRGAGIANQNTSGGAAEGKALTGDLQTLMGQWESGMLTPQSQVGSGGQTIGGLSNFAGNQNPSYTPTAQAPMARPGGQTHLVAEGGHMNKHKSGLDALWEVYAGPHFTEREHFDDGGVAYVGNYDPSSGTTDLGPQFQDQAVPGDPNMTTDQSILDLQQQAKNDPAIANFLKTMGYSTTPQTNVTDASPSGSSSASNAPGTHSVSGDLQNLMKNLTGNGLYGVAKSIGAISPLAALLMRSNTNVARPQGVPGMTAGATPPPAPMFNRTQNMTPSNKSDGSPMSQNDWYTYGSRPEANFFNNNQLPLAQMTGVSHAKGGALGHLAHQEPDGDEGMGMPEFNSATESHAQGPGDGTSDNIPAQLSDGEYVMDANTVSLLGNGSNKAGAERLDQLRENLRKHAAAPMSKGKQFMKAKPPEAYMKQPKKVKGAR